MNIIWCIRFTMLKKVLAIYLENKRQTIKNYQQGNEQFGLIF